MKNQEIIQITEERYNALWRYIHELERILILNRVEKGFSREHCLQWLNEKRKEAGLK